MPHVRNVPGWLIETPIAHRGLHDNPRVPENSLSAFSAAKNAGLPIELDVRLLSDGQPVVFHDHDLARLTGVAGAITDQDAQTIRKLQLLKTDQNIPLLSEVLRLVNGAVPLLIEVKNMHFGVGALEGAVLRTLEGYRGEFAVQSFNPLSVNYFRKHASFICRGQLSLGRVGVPLGWFTKPDFVAYDIDTLRSGFAAGVKRSGMPLLTWTVRTQQQYEKATALADNYIFEDTPDFAVPLSGSHKVQ